MLFFVSGLCIGVICTTGAAIVAAAYVRMERRVPHSPQEWDVEYYEQAHYEPAPQQTPTTEPKARSIQLCR